MIPDKQDFGILRALHAVHKVGDPSNYVTLSSYPVETFSFQTEAGNWPL
jgi:hypothetical protein